ncbi:uncharacterized protein LOC117829310 [Notolabrus celidotus]|uniref:uncharacterized protein LOC117829310 n=1 Tax=Notolabrus celidotus TaxID=1203425 RepID=UPI001490157D|nr:uncharacterized protein LOC117829310 [Notolabrus celidotus]
MQWVKNLRSPFPQHGKLASDRMESTHPITGTSERYSLYDRFHQKNQKRPEEKLRSLNICPALRTEVNCAVAEQFNRELSSVKYSLCHMNEPHFKQTVRLLIHLHNEKINRSFKAEMEALCNTQLSIGVHGMLGLQSADGKENPLQNSDGKPNIQPDSIVTSSFVAQSYAVSDNDMEKLKDLLSGTRDEGQTLTHASGRFPVSINDIRSVCPLELLGQSSLVMPWMNDDKLVCSQECERMGLELLRQVSKFT